MDKLLTFQSQNEKGIFLYTVGEGRDQQFLEKTASAEFHPEIAKYIESAKKIPGKSQLLLTALGAGEYYGSNVNGDYFPEDRLKNPTPEYGYKTFESMAHVYKHHVNKDPNKSYGKVALSVWNEKMKRVELIIVIDDAKAPDIVERLENGETVEVSMGCRVPYDVCSICGNKAKTRAQYCDHLRYHMNKIPPGHTKKAYAINTRPKFFDISFVLVGADRIASVMKKVAHAPIPYSISSAEIAEKHMEKRAFGLNLKKVAARKKLAEMNKKVPSNLDGNISRYIDILGAEGAEALRPLEPELPKTVIIRITRGAPGMGRVNQVLSTLSLLGIIPKRREFQNIVLHALGRGDTAEEFERRGLCFNPAIHEARPFEKSLEISPRHFDESIVPFLSPYIEDKSFARPILHKRIIRLVKLAESGKLEYPIEEVEKVAEDSKDKDSRDPMNPALLMAALTGLYLALGKKAPKVAKESDNFFMEHPGISLALGAGVVTGMKELTKGSYAGKYDYNPEKGPIMNDINMSWQDQIRMRNKTPLTKMGSTMKNVGKSLFLGVPALYMASGVQEVRHARNPGDEGFIGRTVRKYPDVLSAALVGHAMLGSPVSKKLKSNFRFLRKTAQAGNLPNQTKPQQPGSNLGKELLSTAVFSLAFPGKSLVGRLVSNTVDQGVISGVGKLLEHKHSNERRSYGHN